MPIPQPTPQQTRALSRLVQAVFRREVAVQDFQNSPTPLGRLRVRVSVFRERRAILQAERLGIRRERCYGAGDFTVWLTREGTVMISDDRLPEKITLEEANKVLGRYGLRLWPTSDDYRTAVLLNEHGRYLGSASLWDDGGVDLICPDGSKVSLTRNSMWADPEHAPSVVCELRTVTSAQFGEFRPPLALEGQ